MNSHNPFAAKMLDKAQARFIRSRPGSVLILVVALLVLMAVIGTAYMSMAQNDRVAAAQHTFNTEVDLVLEGVLNQVKGTLTQDLLVSENYRPAIPSYNTAGTYTYYNGLGLDTGTAATLGENPGDAWLASRVPDLMLDLHPTSDKSTSTTPTWGFISGPLTSTNVFDTPWWPSNKAVSYTVRTRLEPGVTANNTKQTPSLVDGQYWPAFIQPAGTNTNFGVLAADTDGDGIADAGLVKLLTLDGVTYYAGIRIIDNCAAVNASIAMRPKAQSTYTPNTSLPGDFSPVGLDLEGMLINPGTELYSNLLAYRFNGQNPQAKAYGETGVARIDFSYLTYGTGNPAPVPAINLAYDQQWTQLGRRLDNPGYIAAATSANSKYQALSVADSQALARNFILTNPNTSNLSIAEQALITTTVAAAPSPSAPYQPGNAQAWFGKNFYYFTQGSNASAPAYNPGNYAEAQMPMRALLTARDPVSNFAPAKFFDRFPNKTSPGTGPFNFGDMITYSGDNHRYVCINPNPTAPPIIPTGDPLFQDLNWAFEPWTSAPTKTSANTATFQQLYAAYWAVMADNNTGTPAAPAAQWDYPNKAQGGAGRMFRSSTRGPNAVPAIGPQQMMYLRAAIAAVNTMDLRDSDDDVTSRTIQIPNTSYFATVYGSEKQPYITQVYARNDKNETNDFVGLELYNPYPAGSTPISLKNWQFAMLDRTTMKLTTVVKITTPAAMNPGDRWVFVSTATPANVTMPTPAPTKMVVLTQLTKALGSELVVLRPRRADGTLTPKAKSIQLNNAYDETMLSQLVPVDSYDFTNLPAIAPSAAKSADWAYIRPSTAAKNWHFVYPGPWDTAVKTPVPKQGGTVYTSPPPPKLDATTLGTEQATVAVAGAGGKIALKYQDVPLQVNNQDFGGPLKPTSGGPNNFFPFGGFARNGDLLQVTFVGAYAIWSSDPNPAKGGATLVELNTLSMDSAMATAVDTTPFTPAGTSALAAENIGRFCPIALRDNLTTKFDDFGTNANVYRYHWASRLFDYLTVQSPQDDFTPDVDPWRADVASSTANGAGIYRYLPASKNVTDIPQAVGNTSALVTNALYNKSGAPTYNTNAATEDTAAVNGLVNINSAPWRVLAAVPWTPASVPNYQKSNADIAKAIVYYRDVDDGSGKNRGHGPFKTIFELNEVPYPKNQNTTTLRDWLGNAQAYSTPQYGFLAPITPVTASQVTGDFESQYQTLARVSNLITTRSDSYTAYILVQGWRNAETPTPTLVVQRRAAVIIDRSAVTPTNLNPQAINIPLN